MINYLTKLQGLQGEGSEMRNYLLKLQGEGLCIENSSQSWKMKVIA